jgi:nitrite reductase/ring-hydroxylating ferredoxin subunit
VKTRAAGPIPVARADELAVNQMKLVRVDDRRLVLARTEQGYAAFDDRCTHRGGSLADGAMICGTVQCPWHGSQFDARTGAVKAGPAGDPIRTYRADVRGDDVVIVLDGDAPIPKA